MRKGTAIWLIAIIVASAVLGISFYRIYQPIPQDGECYTFLGHRIQDFPFTYSFDSSVPLEFRDAIVAGAEEWDKFVSGNMFEVGAGKHVISFGPLGGKTLATTSTISEGSILLDADIKFNTNVGWTTNPNPWFFGSSFDVQSVATHEFGHVLGLGHVDCQSHTMAHSTNAEDDSGRTLESGDLAGLRELYI